MGNLSVPRREPRSVSRAGDTLVFELATLLRKCWRHLLVTMAAEMPGAAEGERSTLMEMPGR